MAQAVIDYPLAEFSSDIPNEDWLLAKRQETIEDGRLSWGCFRNFGRVTGRYAGYVVVPLRVLSTLKGQRGEQTNVNRRSLDSLLACMKSSGKLPLTASGAEYAPYIEVDQEGVAWVSEGNHRILAAQALGWVSLPAPCVRLVVASKKLVFKFRGDDERKLFQGIC